MLTVSLFRGREREKHQCVVASHMAPTGPQPATQACVLSWATLWFAAHAQSTELHQPGPNSSVLKKGKLIVFF